MLKAQRCPVAPASACTGIPCMPGSTLPLPPCPDILCVLGSGIHPDSSALPRHHMHARIHLTSSTCADITCMLGSTLPLLPCLDIICMLGSILPLPPCLDIACILGFTLPLPPCLGNTCMLGSTLPLVSSESHLFQPCLFLKNMFYLWYYFCFSFDM